MSSSADLPNPGTEPASPASPVPAGRFFTTSATREDFFQRGGNTDFKTWVNQGEPGLGDTAAPSRQYSLRVSSKLVLETRNYATSVRLGTRYILGFLSFP